MKTLFKLILTSFIAVFLVTVVWLTLKVFESAPKNGSTPTWTHPLSEIPHWDLYRPKKCGSMEELLSEIKPLESHKILFLDLQLQRDQWVVFCSNQSTGSLFQKWQPGLMVDPLVKHLADNDRLFIANIHASQKSEAESFLKLFEGFEKSSRIAVISPSRIPIETLRKERPLWFFGSDRTTWTKVLTFHTVDLSGLAKMWADFYIFTAKDKEVLGGNDTLIKALLKQNKVLIQENSENSGSTEDFFRGVLSVDP